MKITCLKFSSAAVLKEFVHYAYPFVIEEMDIFLCGVFSASELEIAVHQFNASVAATSKNEFFKN